MQHKQIFQATSATRWQRFKWGSRLFFLVGGLALLLIIIWFVKYYYEPSVPQMKSRALAYKKILDSNDAIVYRNSELAKKYMGFRKFFNKQQLRPEAYKPSPEQVFSPKIFPANMTAGIRAAFYVAWDPQSFFSLQRNINHLNLVFPEWMFIDPKTDTIATNVDARAFAVMKQAGVSIMPMLSNFHDSTFHGEAVHRIINDRRKRERLINDVIAILQKNNFAGVNVDFEELQETSDEQFVNFQKELYTKLHAKGFLVTQDVVPFNDDYDYHELSKYNDYMILMAYDQFSDNTKPGPIAEQRWIEGAVDDAAKKMPTNKIILALGAYGYDWPKNHQATNLTYQQALVTARESDATITYDNDTYNLYYQYSDDQNIEHTVYFTDAATSFNSMRFAAEDELAGVAIWRLGSEDSRIWKFYEKDMSKPALRSFDFEGFRHVISTDDVDYMGEGEILDVKAVPTNGKITTELDSTDVLISEESYDELPSMFVVQKYGKADPKKLVLTFDDGPDAKWTRKVLDILGEKHVPATFFVVGINAENNIPLVKRMYREGHEIGNHTFTHPNIAEVSKRRALFEMEATRSLLECITGHSTILFRAPYNADFEPEKMEELEPVALARTRNYLDVGESIDPMDWEPGVVADSIVARTIARKNEMNAAGLGGNIILLHDAGGETRAETVKALPRIIDYFRSRGYEFTTVADLLGKKKADLMPAVPKGSGYYILQVFYFIAEFFYWAGSLLFSLFILFIILSISRIGLMAFLANKQRKKEKRNTIPLPLTEAEYPLVSIIVPAYNEEVNAVSSLHNLLRTDYPNFNIIFVDDGSKDSTYEKVSMAFQGYSNVVVLAKPNGGKASALNYGISQTNAEYVVCIDADTKLRPDAVSLLMKHFLTDEQQEIGAVAGNVKVGNEVNILTKWQAIEYISSQNFDRRAFAYLNAITVVPGAIGGFRKQAIEDAGGFTTDTLAEDADITVRIVRAGYIIENEADALAFTEAPEKLKQFMKQRYRWSFGILQTVWKNRDALFNSQYKWLGWLALPNILLFQYIIPFFIPFADIIMVIGLMTGNTSKIIPYYIGFMLFDAAIAILAFHMENEKVSRLVWLIPQRLIYRWFMWVVLIRSIRRALKGELQSWGVLKRTGKVKDPIPAYESI
ncbi:MAG: polysaccharide deacetylase family protein [Candidatus Dadabacteria bacterium]